MIRTFLVAVAVLVSSVATASASIYGLVDLGTLSRRESHAFDVNTIGQVVGESLTDDGEFHAFLYQNGLTLGFSVLPLVHRTSRANSINDNDVIVVRSAVGCAVERRQQLVNVTLAWTSPLHSHSYAA